MTKQGDGMSLSRKEKIKFKVYLPGEVGQEFEVDAKFQYVYPPSFLVQVADALGIDTLFEDIKRIEISCEKDKCYVRVD